MPAYQPDPEQLRELEIWEVLRPIQAILVDVQQIKLVLSGGRALSADERIRFTAALKRSLEGCDIRSIFLKDSVKAFATAERAKLIELAADPVRLAVLHRVVSQLEEVFQKRLRRLRNGQ